MPPILGVKKICIRGMRTVHQYRSLTVSTVLAYDKGIPSMQLSLEQTANNADGFAIDEPMPRLVSELRAVLRSPHTTAEERIQQARAILSALPGVHHEKVEAIQPVAGKRIERGGLAPWQVRCLKDYIEQRLTGRLTGAELAGRVCLSEHHFCRAFRVSIGQAPHAYVVRRRVERACHMMLSSNSTIGCIASECGFADQAHLNRCFRSLMGTSPGVWRRARIEATNIGRQTTGINLSDRPRSTYVVATVSGQRLANSGMRAPR